MTTKKVVKAKNQKYIKLEDIQNFIYESDEEESPKKCIIQKNIIRATANGDIKSLTKSKTLGNLFDSYGEAHESIVKSNIQEYQGGKSILGFFENSNRQSFTREYRQLEKVNSFYGKLNESVDENTDIIKFPEFNCSTRKEVTLFSWAGKRSSPTKITGTNFCKKFKADSNKSAMNDVPPTLAENTELKMESSGHNVPFKRRNINTIMEELELISIRWKEGYSKYKFPIQWGMIISKNCSEKWDSQYIPMRLVDQCEKYIEQIHGKSGSFAATNNQEPDVRGVDKQTVLKMNEEISDSSASVKIDYGDPSNCNSTDCDDLDAFSTSNPMEDLNSFSADSHGNMLLEGSNQTRNNMEGDMSNVEVKDHLVKRKNKKGSFKSNRDKKCNQNRKSPGKNDMKCTEHENLDCNKNVDIECNFELSSNVDSSQMRAASSQYGDKLVDLQTNEEELVMCPICSKKFDKQLIENHATNCAFLTFKD